MNTIRLREATADDLPAMAALMEQLPEWFTAEAVENVRTAGADLPGLVGLDEAGAVVGFLLWEQPENECYIRWIAVARERQRQSIGKMLMARLLELVRARGVTCLRVATVAPTVDHEPYARTRAFYEACGFILCKVELHGWPDGTDRAEYVLDLGV